MVYMIAVYPYVLKGVGPYGRAYAVTLRKLLKPHGYLTLAPAECGLKDAVLEPECFSF